jgi:hypothetical protein
MRRREFMTLLAGAVAWPIGTAMGQPSDRMRRIAMLSGFAAGDPEAQARVAALQQGLSELGWSEGRNISIDFRWSTGQPTRCEHSPRNSSSSGQTSLWE